MDHNHLLEYHESENLLFYTVFISPGEPNESGLFFCNRKTSNACCEINTLLGFSWLVMVLVYGFPILFYVSEFLIIKCWIGMIWLWLLRRRCGRPLAYYRTHNMTVKEVPLKLSWHKGSYLGSSYWILRNSNITFLHSGTQELFNAD